jgi:hypothetical protein
MGLTPGRLKRFSVRILVWLASDLKSLFGVSFLLGVLLATLFHNYQVRQQCDGAGQKVDLNSIPLESSDLDQKVL